MLAPTPREFDRLVPRAWRHQLTLARCVRAIVMLLGLVACCAGIVRADDDDADEDDSPPVKRRVTPVQHESSDSSPLTGKGSSNGSTSGGLPGEGFGVDFIPGFQYGQGVVNDRPLAPIEAFPFFLMNDSLFFSDLRFYPTIDGTFGGSLGGGYRYFSPGMNRIFGASLWYDGDGTRDLYFQQIGLSLETYGLIDFRTNLYFPVGQTYQQNSQSVVSGSPRFTGESLVYDQLTSYLAAMRGIDFEFGLGIPGRFAEDHGIRAYLGGYFYNDQQGDDILGISGRVQANIWSGLDASVQVTNDNYFNTRAFINVAWTFGPLHRSELSQATAQGRFGERVTRNYTVLATSHSNVQSGIEAIDPNTHHPYVIAHVDSAAAPGGNGSVNSPFQTIAAAQASGATVIFVHANSIFHGNDATVVMSDGDKLFGDGVGERNFLPVSKFGQILLPHGPTIGNLPVLDSANGTAVTLANNVLLSGFTITNSSGAGIVGNGIGGATLRDLTVRQAGSDGIQIVNATGNTLLTNVNVLNSAGNGLLINGGDANVQYSGNLAANSGHDLVVENVGTDSVINMNNALFPGSGSQGILLENVAGTVNFNNLTLGNTTTTGIDIEGGAGRYNFAGLTTVSAAGAASILVQGLGATGTVNFGTLNINNRHDEGFVINNSSGAVQVNGTTTITNEGGTGASAIDIKNSSGGVNFVGKVNVDNTTLNPGVSITNDSGTTNFSTALNISSINGTALFANNGGTLVINGAQVAGAGGTIQAINGTALDIENTTMNLNLFSVSSSNAATGIKLINAPGQIAIFGNSHETPGSGGTIQGDTVGILLQNTGTVGLLSMILNGNGTGIQTTDTTYLALTNVQVINSAAAGIDSLDTKTLVLLSSTFGGNGGPNVNARVDTVASYAYSFLASSFTSSTSDNIQLQTLAGGQGSTVNLVAQANSFENDSLGTSGINVNWNGTLSATVTQNSFVGTGGTNTGLKINNAATSNLSTISFTNNLFKGEGGTDTALNVVLGGAGQINVATNGVQFSAPTGTAFHFSLAAPSTVNITGNVVVDSTDGATGILFDTIAAPSNVAISGNTIQLAQNGAQLTSGILFSNVTNTTQGSQSFFLNLASSSNNTITGANTLFLVPPGTTTGEVLINGSPMP